MFCFDSELGSVILLGLCFTVIFSSDFTVTNMQKTITVSIHNDKPDYNIDGYVSLGLTYAVYGVSLWLAPAFIAFSGAKYGIFFGAFPFVAVVFSFLLEAEWATYTGMVIGGIGGSALWVAQANYVVLVSERSNITRNVGIFWFLYVCSLIFGNLYAVFELNGKTVIDATTRHTLLYVLGAVVITGIGMVLFLPSPTKNKFNQDDDTLVYDKPLDALKKTWAIFCRKEVLVLCLSFIYEGLQQAFGQGVYAPCLGFTKQFGTIAKQLVPLSGVVYGVGDLSGGLLQTFVAKRARVSWWASMTVCLGFLGQLLSYILTYINIPNNAVFGETSDRAAMDSSIAVALICSFLLGFGDSCLNTQIFPLLAVMEPNQSAQTSALYKFVKSMAMAACFFVSPYLGLHIQMSIIIAGGVLGTLAFLFTDLKLVKRTQQ